MTTPKNGDTVIFDYVLTRGNGEVVSDTGQVGPQELTIGQGEIFPQVEEALASMAVGDQQLVTIPCDKAFGPRRDDMIADIPRSNLPPEPAPEPGMVLQAQQPDGSTVPLYIIEVSEQAVKVDGNHPLAGEDVTFDVTLRGIQPAG